VSERFQYAVHAEFRKVRAQEKGNPLPGPGQRHPAQNHRQQQQKQKRHQNFRTALDPFADSEDDHPRRQRHENDQLDYDALRVVVQIVAEHLRRFGHLGEMQPARKGAPDIIDDPRQT